jgi:hypothetical protein
LILRPEDSSLGVFFARMILRSKNSLEAENSPLGIFFASEELFYAMFLSVEFSGTGFQEKLY